ncbi:MAG TPA: NUDIX hydrolase [Candidatus Saccharimonadales bacterium]|nr:NUDIX hydrolase [Candidatus Saccharimonadales bacterium]
MKKPLLWFGMVLFWLSWPVLWLYLRRSNRTRLLLVAEDKFLALRGWLGGMELSMPGGGIHHGEAPAIALLREVKEEIGLELQETQLRHAFSEEYRQYGLHFGYDCFVVVLPKKPDVILQRKEIAESAWLPLDTPVEGLGPELRAALAWWKSKG